ncbi:hypothetical protein CONPUDRAFT_72034 [Coniophora puteana RWD-64-598 SS2]|uniref:F-box domain-containing protein n=1 Tax=Coniophora puteana (strain RWD-64-598) TaxID=741705 RepID=A0A5M3MXJ3_CONPW|nr:uncharacterized protein CONPUDRAFT_72034 [Coniophora puteana RWD-64-598 SS2]EIW83494.1 hypothetical protein CONPUDRAFT_72034 [Coniophora puteana RWD-64-598 SS2]
MHRCLDLYEVVYHIFAQLCSDQQGKATLARLARVCTAFKDVALDHLYSNVEHFSNLLSCLPGDILQKPDWIYDEHVRFRRGMTDRDWAILVPYAARVETLRFSFQHQESSPSEDVLRVLNECPTGILFPKLRSLTLLQTHRLDAPLLRFLFCPQVDQLYLDGCPSRLFEEIDVPMLCPSVEHLGISNEIYDVQISSETMAQALRRWPLLKHVKCPSLAKDGLIILASLPRLRSLDIVVANSTPWVSESVDVAFHSLQSLGFIIDSPDACASALRSLATNSSGSLTPLVVPEVTIASNLLFADAITPLIDVTTPLSHYVAPDRLTSLHFSGSGETLIADPPFNGYAGFEPLSVFSQLRHIKIEYALVQLDFSLLSVGRSWPLLETFWLTRTNVAISLGRAMKFLAVWPRLRVFHLPVMVIMEHVEALAANTETHKPHKCIKKMQLETPGGDERPNVQQVADVFARLVPRLSEVETYPDRQLYWKTVLNEMRIRCRDDETVSQA